MSAGQLRRAFAESLRAKAEVKSAALIDAFARVPREKFLPGSSLEELYRDVAVPIDRDRMLNNGHPSVLARWLDAAAPGPGEEVLHVGCGVGYYTAIIAELVGAGGRVLAYEVDAGLAARAKRSLAEWPQVQVEAGDAAAPAGRFDVVFVNAGATHARAQWLDVLAEGGRMLLPLTVHLTGVARHGVGVMALTERRGTRWPFSVVSPTGIFDCEGARDAALEAALAPIVMAGAESVRAIEVGPHPRGPDCLVHAAGFCLQR